MAIVNGWEEWGKHVLKELERLSSGIEKLDSKVDEKMVYIYKELSTQRAKIAGVAVTASLLITLVLNILIAVFFTK